MTTNLEGDRTLFSRALFWFQFSSYILGISQGLLHNRNMSAYKDIYRRNSLNVNTFPSLISSKENEQMEDENLPDVHNHRPCPCTLTTRQVSVHIFTTDLKNPPPPPFLFSHSCPFHQYCNYFSLFIISLFISQKPIEFNIQKL